MGAHRGLHRLTQLGEASRPNRRSLWMLPTFALVYFATSFVGIYVIFPLLRVKEGEPLFDRSVAGRRRSTVNGPSVNGPSVNGPKE